MNSIVRHCQTRRSLQQQLWKSSSWLRELTSRLMSLAGQNQPEAFCWVRVNCEEASANIAVWRQQLQAHRAEHGC